MLQFMWLQYMAQDKKSQRKYADVNPTTWQKLPKKNVDNAGEYYSTIARIVVLSFGGRAGKV
jgi:hypothetical protein